jgi:hypothetical protein
MPNMKTKGQRNLKLLGGQEKPDGQPDGRTAGRPDKLIPVYPPYNFVVRGYNYLSFKIYFFITLYNVHLNGINAFGQQLYRTSQ